MDFGKLKIRFYQYYHIDLQQFMKPGISKNAKAQISYNSYVKNEQKKFEIKNLEN